LAETKPHPEPWHFWGPYLAERAWGTVREDYSANGDAWNYFPHDHARSRTYRWNEDGIGGISDYKGRLCFAFAFWNERDPFLKERILGVSGPEGNHGEDVKELYWYVDSSPSHSFMRMVYRYPQSRFPYEELVAQSGARSKMEGEFEIWNTTALAENRYFDVEIEYAKADPHDILIRVSAKNCGPESAPLHLLPTIWFRNTWSWDRAQPKPTLHKTAKGHAAVITASHTVVGNYDLFFDSPDDLFFTKNESNSERLWGIPNSTPFVKDSINDRIVSGKIDHVNSAGFGTKAAAYYKFNIPAKETTSIQLRLTRASANKKTNNEPFADFEEIFTKRRAEADEFYGEIAPSSLTEEQRAVQRQAFGGLLWTKQFYHYIVDQWLDGDPDQPPPPDERKHGRNSGWRHLYNERVMSMPDKWEFPWYASWDLAFHCIPLALVDVQFANAQFPDGTHLEQSDGTSWMGMFSLNLMRIAIELARENHVYENIATKFFEHFLMIAAAMNKLCGKGVGLWDEEDEFYYDVLHTP